MAKYTKLTSTATFTLWNTISNTYNFLKAFILFEYTVCILDLIHSFIKVWAIYETFASLNWNTEFYEKTSWNPAQGRVLVCLFYDGPNFMHNLTLPARSRRLWWVSWSLYHTATKFLSWNFLHCIIFFLFLSYVIRKLQY